jgi:peptidoglycan hydrolase-like protein with peptidoglycan-binding domain
MLGSMTPSGITALDALLTNPAAVLPAGNRDAVGAVQALLIGHGFRRLPTMLAPAYGTFGPETSRSVVQFQSRHRLPPTGVVDQATVRALVAVAATAPLISRPYATLVLDVPFEGLLPLATLTMQFEGGGYFCAANLNTDECGLSFGLIQWAQKPGRLGELLLVFHEADEQRFIEIFGDGDRTLAEALLAHAAKPSGGVDPVSGLTTDARFALEREPWQRRFADAGRDRTFQRAQVEEAVRAFTVSTRKIQATMPLVSSERGLAFMLDVANQFGDGGARSISRAVMIPGSSEPEFLLRVEQESVRRVERQYGVGSQEARSTAHRREALRTTPLLSDAAVTIS